MRFMSFMRFNGFMRFFVCTLRFMEFFEIYEICGILSHPTKVELFGWSVGCVCVCGGGIGPPSPFL